jgi:hypothetical protein
MDLLYWAEGEKTMKHTLKELGFRVVGEGKNKHLEAPGYLPVDTPEDLERAEEVDEVLECLSEGKPLPTVEHVSQSPA